MRLLLLSSLLAGIATATFAQGRRQPLEPPNDTPGMAIPNLMMNRTADWPTDLGFPQPQIVRTMAGERWYLIELRRGDFSCGGKCGDNLGNLFAPGTGWVPVTLAHGAQNMYTFNTVPSWATHDGSTNEAPSDIDQKDEECQAPLAGQRRPEGNCIWAEWVTTLMQRNCGVHAQPAQPLVGRCNIHYFEGWNEYNAESFWKDSLAHLVKMDIDADQIIKTYCSDCYFMAGSVTAGGTGWHARAEAGSGQWNVALGQYLDAWHARSPELNPDIVSIHLYPSRDNVNPMPFPETMVSEGDPTCTRANTPNKACNQPIVSMPDTAKEVIRERKWLNPQTPIWNTESGDPNTGLLLGTVVDPTMGKPVADAASEAARQAWVSRFMILASNSGLAENTWYLFDNQCLGTLYGFSKPPNLPCRQPQPAFRAGMTPQGQAWIETYRWLHGGRFDRQCSGSHNVWSCRITRADGTPAEIVWVTEWQKTAAYPTAWTKAADVDGKTTDVRGSATISNRPILLYGGAERKK
jgi:hypothetical protein